MNEVISESQRSLNNFRKMKNKNEKFYIKKGGLGTSTTLEN